MLINKLRYSGAYKMFIWLANALCNQGHTVTVMTYMLNDLNNLNPKIDWIQYDYEHKNIIRKIIVIRKEIKRVNPDVSISFLLDANVYNTFACLGHKAKSVICERNDPFKPGYNVLKFWKPLFRYAKGAVFQLHEVSKYYDNIQAPIAIIPNPVVLHENTTITIFNERPNIINILGRLDLYQKRHDVMIDAFYKFNKEYPDFKLFFYGDGPDKDRMQIQIDKLGLSNNVFFCGVTSNPSKIMAQSKMFILTSDFEGIPNSLLEAMSIGLPCISTDCRPGGARLLIEDNVNGFLVPQGDSNALADRMIWYMNHPDYANIMGDKAKHISEQFSEHKIIELWETYLNDLLK